MSRLEIILSCMLFISVILNIGVFVYARAAIVRLLWIAEELNDLQTMTNSFSNHLESVYETEMFYGDETLRSLIEHARSFDEQLETFEFVYTLVEKEADNNDDDEENAGQET